MLRFNHGNVSSIFYLPERYMIILYRILFYIECKSNLNVENLVLYLPLNVSRISAYYFRVKNRNERGPL